MHSVAEIRQNLIYIYRTSSTCDIEAFISPVLQRNFVIVSNI